MRRSIDRHGLTFAQFFAKVFLPEYSAAKNLEAQTVEWCRYLIGDVACRWIGEKPIGAVDGGAVDDLVVRLRNQVSSGGAESWEEGRRARARALQIKCQPPGFSTVTIDKALTVLEYVLTWAASSTTVAQTTPIAAASELFFAARADLAPGSAALYRYHLRRHVLPHIGNLSIGSVTDGVRRDLRKTLATVGKCTTVYVPGAYKKDGSLKKPWEVARDKRRGGTAGAGGRRYSDQTIRNLVVYVRAVLRWAFMRKHIPVLPAIAIPSVSPPQMAVPYTAAEARALIAAAATDQRRVMYLISYDTGCRKSELLGLEWEQVDWEHHEITFPKRSVPMSAPLELALKRLRLAQGALGSHVFCQPNGAPLEAHHLRTFEERDAEAAGLRKVAWPRKRHPGANQVVEIGTQPWEMLHLLGHADVRTTEHFVDGKRRA